MDRMKPEAFVAEWEAREEYFRREIKKLREWYETNAKEESIAELEPIYQVQIAELERKLSDALTLLAKVRSRLPMWLYKRLVR